MANTYSDLYVHFVFSTKRRRKLIHEECESRIWQYLGGIVRKHDSSALQIGGVEDHIHALIQSPPKYSPSDVAQYLKGESSKWIKDEIPNLSKFGWQDGYSAFSVSRSIVPRVVRYIQNQRKHHENLSFKDEYLELLRLHEVDLRTEQYIFD